MSQYIDLRTLVTTSDKILGVISRRIGIGETVTTQDKKIYVVTKVSEDKKMVLVEEVKDVN